MADPLAVLGAAAAGLQVVEIAATACLRTVRFVKDLKDVPQKLAVLLQDVEKSTARVHYIFSAMLQPGSKVFEQLDPAQFGSLVKTATELRQAMDDVNAILKPLVGSDPSATEKAMQRLWKSVTAVKAKKGVMEKLERVDRLNNEVNRQLAITGLELQATVSDKLDQAVVISRNDQAGLIDAVETNSRKLQVTIHERQNATRNHLTSIESTGRDVHQTITEVRGNVTSLNTDMRRVAEATTDMRQTLATFANQERTESISHQQMQDLLSQRASRTDILQLRDDIISMLTGQKAELSVISRMTTQSLSQNDQNFVEESTRQQLLSCPSSLAEACTISRRGGITLPKRCRCRLSRQSSHTKIWGLSFRAEESNEHRPDCHYAKSGSRSWSYSMRAVLAPFLNATLELAIGATTGHGNWSMAPPLRFHGTVKRSQSPLFQAFDRFPALCVKRVFDSYHPGCTILSWFQMENILPEIHSRDLFTRFYFYVEWDIGNTKRQLSDLGYRIRLAIESGHASGTDSDEQGQTLFFGFVKLLLLFADSRCWRLLSAELHSLCNVIMACGASMAVQNCKPEQNLCLLYLNNNSSSSPVTCWDLFFLSLDSSGWDCLSHIPFVLEHAVGYTSRSGTGYNVPEHDLGLFLPHSSSMVKAFQKYPEVAEAIGALDDLDIAVLHKTAWSLERALAQASKRDHLVQNRAIQSLILHRFDLTELALGWEGGLRQLVAAGYPVNAAVLTAISLKDSKSLSILLETPTALFSQDSILLDHGDSSNVLGRIYAVMGERDRDTILDLVLGELTRRRKALQHLALKTLPSNEQRKLALDQEGILDLTAEHTFRRLTHVTAVPKSLNCWMSPYQATRDCLYYSRPLRFLNSFYQAGFKSVDIRDDEGDTPLFYKASRAGSSDQLVWFLSHGARPDRPIAAGAQGSTRYPNILFYVALRHKYIEWDVWWNAALVPSSLHLVTDGCLCLCGTKGCIPSHLLWRCNESRWNRVCQEDNTFFRRSESLHSWIQQWRVPELEMELVYSGVVRLELFERLGMAHTCCGNAPSYQSFVRRMCPDEQERVRLQDEDSELALQLNDLAAHYKKARGEHVGGAENLWRLWWQVVDEILPPLLPIEACKCRLKPYHERDTQEFRQLDRSTIENRALHEREALATAGYVGAEFEDFGEVIRVHFDRIDWNPTLSDSWEDCSSDASSYASESSPED